MTTPLLATRDALIRELHELVCLAEDPPTGCGLADALLASGVVVTPDVYLSTLAEDDDLIQRVHYGCEGNEYVNVEAVLTALAAEFATPTTEETGT